MQNHQHKTTSSHGTQPIALIPQLMQYATQARHIDDIFLWVANALVEHWQVSVAQIWVLDLEQMQTEIRASASLRTEIPYKVHINMQVASAIGQLLRENPGVVNTMTVPTSQVFPSTQASVMAHYGLLNWACHAASKGILLPPPKGSVTTNRRTTPLKITLSLFGPQTVSAELIRAASFLVEQALRVATMRGLVPNSDPQGPVTPIPPTYY